MQVLWRATCPGGRFHYNEGVTDVRGSKARNDFSWDILRSILEGHSPIDLPALALMDREEANQFLLQYGYDMEDEEDREVAWRVHVEALAFIKRYLCDGTDDAAGPVVVPADIERPTDLRDLLVWASDRNGSERQAWACALLRIMHTISHVNNTLRSEFFPEIKRQILDRFKQHVHQDSRGRLTLGRGPLSVPLLDIFYKEEKSRDSLILKLLHKPHNVAEIIHDRLGVKMVTPNRLDALLALRYLRQNHLILFANVTPGRSRNTLVNLDRFRDLYESLTSGLADLTEEGRDRQFLSLLHENAPEMDDLMPNLENPFTSPDYRSIQFTVQQLVKLENPGYLRARRMRLHLEKYHLGPDLEGLVRELEGPQEERELRIFFPLEVQILDEENFRRTQEGAASHVEYKNRQIQAARRRVLGPLLNLVRRGEPAPLEPALARDPGARDLSPR